MITNTIANFLGLFLSLLLSFVFAPIFLYYLGDDQYGLIGIFLLFQITFAVLDVGLSPTLARQISHARGLQKDFYQVLKLLKSFEVIFLSFAFLTLLVFLLAREMIIYFIQERSSLDDLLISECVVILGFLISVRWFFSLYRSGLVGFEDQVWLNVTISVTNTSRYLLILGLLLITDIDVTYFFALQLFFTIVDVVLLRRRLYLNLSVKNPMPPLIYFDFHAVRKVLPFTLSVAVSAILWMAVNDLHKTALAIELTLKEYGYFTITTMLSGAIILIAQPVSQSLIPRLTVLKSKRSDCELMNVYTQSSQFIVALSFSIMTIFWFYAEDILTIWTQNEELATWGVEPLRWFSLGNCFLCLSAFPYYLQVATGKLNLHLYGQLFATCLQVPIIYFATISYGAVGAGIAWAVFRSVWFFTWVAFIHTKFLPDFHTYWLFLKISPIIVTIVLISTSCFTIMQQFAIDNSFIIILLYIGIFLLTFILGSLWIDGIRAKITEQLNYQKNTR